MYEEPVRHTNKAGILAEGLGKRFGDLWALRNLDFEVLSPQKAESAKPVPTTSIPNQRRTNGIEPVVAICPTCFLALSADGSCDNCD